MIEQIDSEMEGLFLSFQRLRSWSHKKNGTNSVGPLARDVVSLLLLSLKQHLNERRCKVPLVLIFGEQWRQNTCNNKGKKSKKESKREEEEEGGGGGGGGEGRKEGRGS